MSVTIPKTTPGNSDRKQCWHILSPSISRDGLMKARIDAICFSVSSEVILFASSWNNVFTPKALKRPERPVQSGRTERTISENRLGKDLNHPKQYRDRYKVFRWMVKIRRRPSRSATRTSAASARSIGRSRYFHISSRMRGESSGPKCRKPHTNAVNHVPQHSSEHAHCPRPRCRRFGNAGPDRA